MPFWFNSPFCDLYIFYIVYNRNINHFSPSTSAQQSETPTTGRYSAIREACESDLVSYFRTDEGSAFKNEFCALCKFPDIYLKSLRNCEQDSELTYNDNIYNMKMLLTLIDTLPDPVSDNEKRTACTSSYNVSQL